MNAAPAPITRRYANYVFILLFLLYLFDYTDRLIIVSLFPFIKEDWGISDTQLGLLVSAVYWSILIFSLPLSILVDRWSRKKSIGLMAIVWSIATAACAFTRNFGQLFAVRTAIGLGESGYAPGGTAMISALYPPDIRAKVLGFWNASIPLGSAVGIALGGFIAEHYGWRHAFGIVAIPGFILGLMFFWVRDYKTVDLVHTVEDGGQASQKRMRLPDIARMFVRSKSLIFNNLAFAMSVFVTTSLLTWLPSYFNRLYDIPMTKAGPKGAVVMLLSVVGAPLGGWLADKWWKKQPRGRLLFPAVSSLVTAIILFVVFTFLRGNAQYIVLLLAGMAAVGFIASGVAVTQDVVHPGLRATSLSLNIIVQHLLGSALGPPIIGRLSDHYGLETAMQFLPLFTLLAAGLFFVGSFFYEKDLSMVERVDLEIEG
jgi:MFS family permease